MRLCRAMFSEKDSKAIEAAYSKYQADVEPGEENEVLETKIAAGEDKLFEVDIEKKEYYPVYWLGPIYEVRRGTWFIQASSNQFHPCDDNLARQMEDGYRYFLRFYGFLQDILN